MVANNPLTIVDVPGGQAILMLGAEDDAETVDNLDVQLVLNDQTRWSATVLTLKAIDRLMTSYKASGECLGGRYFQCSDLLIAERSGVSSIVDLLCDLVRSGEYRDAMVRVDIEE
jgi:hypothetical protein